MTIFRITRAFYPVVDGAASHAWYLSKCQAEEGHHVFLFQPYAAGLRLGPPNVQMISSIANGLSGEFSRCKLAVLILAVSAAAKALLLGRRIHPDVIHVHGDAIDAFVLGLAGRMLKCPVVITLHGTLNTGAGYRFFAPLLFRLVKRLIVVSDSIARSLLDLGIPAAQIRSISSGIDLARFSGAPMPAPLTPRPTIVSVGRLHRVKGYQYLIAAAARLAEKGMDCEIVVVGEGPDRTRLEALAAGSGGVRFHGEAGPAEIATLLSRADIFVLPSITLPGQAEGTPTAAMEAMAAGLPVVATATGGIPGLVDHGQGGFLVPERDPEALAEALHLLLRNPTLAWNMGVHNRKSIAGKDWRLVSGHITQAYGIAVAA